MRRLIFIAALVICASPLALGQTPAAQTGRSTVTSLQGGNTEQAVIARLQAFRDALRKRDNAALAPFYTDDYVIITANGQMETKAQRLETLKSNPPPASIDFTDLKVRLYGDTAVVTGHATSQAEGGGRALNERVTWVWVKQGGTWRLANGQITTIAPAQSATQQMEKKP